MSKLANWLMRRWLEILGMCTAFWTFKFYQLTRVVSFLLLLLFKNLEHSLSLIVKFELLSGCENLLRFE